VTSRQHQEAWVSSYFCAPYSYKHEPPLSSYFPEHLHITAAPGAGDTQKKERKNQVLASRKHLRNEEKSHYAPNHSPNAIKTHNTNTFRNSLHGERLDMIPINRNFETFNQDE
jgi:hypothetical protein